MKTPGNTRVLFAERQVQDNTKKARQVNRWNKRNWKNLIIHAMRQVYFKYMFE